MKRIKTFLTNIKNRLLKIKMCYFRAWPMKMLAEHMRSEGWLALLSIFTCCSMMPMLEFNYVSVHTLLKISIGGNAMKNWSKTSQLSCLSQELLWEQEERIPTWSELHIPTLHLCHHLFIEAMPQEHMLNEIYTTPAQQCWHSDEIDVPAFLLLIIFSGLNVSLTAWPMESGNGRVSCLLWLSIDSHNYKRSESIGTNESDLSPASDSANYID